MDRDNPTVEIVGANEYFNNLKTLAIRECLKNPNDEKAIEALINSAQSIYKFLSGEYDCGDKKISISEEEYDSLLKDSILLNCLQMMGVDNWDGYGDAIEQYQEILQQEEK
jgi:hypothetical protein